jgi:hypothetical protein
MKQQRTATESLWPLGHAEVSGSTRRWAAEQGCAPGGSHRHPLTRSARIAVAKPVPATLQRGQIAWFMGLYATSLASISGMIGATRWALSLL